MGLYEDKYLGNIGRSFLYSVCGHIDAFEYNNAAGICVSAHIGTWLRNIC